jgi:hypothetical protein
VYFFRWQSPCVVGGIGCIIVLSLWPHDTAAGEWKERLRTEAPPKWTALEQYYAKMEMSYRKIIAIPTEGKPIPESFLGTIYQDVCVNGDRIVCTSHHVGKDDSGKSVDTTFVRGVNSRYFFELAKTAPDADTFILSNFQPVSDKARQKVFNGGASNARIAFAGSQFGRLSDIIKDPRFTISNIHGVRRDGKEVVQFEYGFTAETPDKQAPPQHKEPWAEHGVVVVDPQHSWCILRTHFDNPNWTGDETVEYGDAIDGFPIPRRCTHTSTHKKGMGNGLIICEFDKLVHRDIPESEFTLSAFGLPEMQVPGEQKPQTLWRWLLGIGIALGVLAVLLRIYVKKKRQQTPQQV